MRVSPVANACRSLAFVSRPRMRHPDESRMRAKVQAHLAKSRRRLQVAQLLLSHNSEHGPISSAYFAMFHAATAMGIAEGETFPACSGWVTAFGEAFAIPRKIDPKFHADLLQAYRLRQIADYEPLETISEQVTQSMLKKAAEFVAMAEGYLKTQRR